jgi:hypothetical protein
MGVPQKAYVLVAPRERRVEVFRRTSGWTGQSTQSGSVRLESLDVTLALGPIFEGLD